MNYLFRFGHFTGGISSVRDKKLIFPAILLATAFSGAAYATPLNGTLQFGGNVMISTDINTGDGTLTFQKVAGQNYTFTVDGASGDLSFLMGGGIESPIGTVIAPINTPLNIPDFLIFVNDPDLSFTLTYVYGGIDGTAGCVVDPTHYVPGGLCTPPDSPYNLQDLAPTGGGPNSSASFVVEGLLVNGQDALPATITFTAASTGESFEQILFDQATGHPDIITYGAQLQTFTPEPNTYCLTLGGLLLLAGGIRRRSNR
jgi:hypothetical protein